MDKTKLTFRKKERLKSTKAIASLFQDGQTALVYPIKFVWKALDHPSPFPIQAAFSVSGRLFKKSSDRNLLKRRMRESYRLNKLQFYESAGEKKFIIMFIFIGKEEIPFTRINQSMLSGCRKIFRNRQTF
jgi:ribonuclease P protein component